VVSVSSVVDLDSSEGPLPSGEIDGGSIVGAGRAALTQMAAGASIPMSGRGRRASAARPYRIEIERWTPCPAEPRGAAPTVMRQCRVIPIHDVKHRAGAVGALVVGTLPPEVNGGGRNVAAGGGVG
jgi:hypothetical protein